MGAGGGNYIVKKCPVTKEGEGHACSESLLFCNAEIREIVISETGTSSIVSFSDPISNPEPAILCGGLSRLWETPAKFGL
jgi:hypothetical protein